MTTGNGFVVLAANLFLYFLCNSFSLATIINPPTFVHRADLRGPMEIFRSGMKNLGANENLIDHVTGDSCTMGTMKNTAFVATSLEEDTATAFGLNLLWDTPGHHRNVYVYKVRATEFFYDVQESLKKAYKATGNDDYLDMAEAFEVEQEWVAYGGISRPLIMSVKVYSKGSRKGEGTLVRTDTNELYFPEKSRGNSDAFPVSRLTKRLTLVSGSSAGTYSACFLSDCPSTSLGRSGEACVRPNVYTTTLEELGTGGTGGMVETGWYWDTQKRILKQGPIPWKEVTRTRGDHTIQKPE